MAFSIIKNKQTKNIVFNQFQGHTWLSWQHRTFQKQVFRSNRAGSEAQCNQTHPSYRQEDCQSPGEADFPLVPQTNQNSHQGATTKEG